MGCCYFWLILQLLITYRPLVMDSSIIITSYTSYLWMCYILDTVATINFILFLRIFIVHYEQSLEQCIQKHILHWHVFLHTHCGESCSDFYSIILNNFANMFPEAPTLH